MEEKGSPSNVARVLLTATCFVILVAGMRAAGSILVPFLLSLFIAIICAPSLFWMERKGVPMVVAVLSIIVGIIGLGLLLTVVVGTSVTDFSRTLPFYQERLSAKTAGLISFLQGLGLDVSKELITDYFDPGKLMKVAGDTLTGLSGLLSNILFIMLTVIFILLEASGFPQKLRAAVKDPEESLGRLSTFTESVNRYLAIKTFTSLMTGVLIWIWLWILGVNYALLWGLLAFLFNYVPNIGSFIAAIPAILMAFIQLDARAGLLASLGYIAVNVAVGSVIEPRFMGRGLGLSTLVVFLSLVFWGWVLGPVGMVLSVPLTMIVKIALESSEETRWVAVILGPAPGDVGKKAENDPKDG
jgi:AI-2 transport protein TqsA